MVASERVYPDAGGFTDVTVNQTTNGGKWVSLGTFQLDPGQNHRVEISSLHIGRSANADAIGFDPVGASPNTATWEPTLPVSDTYKVFAWWPGNPGLNWASNAKFTVHHAGGTTVVSKDMRASGGTWRLLGSFQMDPGQGHKVVLSDDANNILTADAIAFDAASQADKAVWTLPVNTADQYFVYVRWNLPSNYAANQKYTVFHGGGATEFFGGGSGYGQWQFVGTFNLTPGQNHRVELSGFANGTVSADAVAIESATSSPGNQAIWTLPLTAPDKYDVYARWGSNDSAAGNAKYVVTHAGGTDTVTMNQNANAGSWNKLGTYDLAPGAGHNVNLSDRTNGVVQADAIRLVSAEGAERIARWQGTVTNAGTYQVWARWPAAPTHTFAASYDIVTPGGTDTVTANQRIEGGRWHLLKTITLAANDNWKVELSDQSPGEVVADAVALTPPLSLADHFDWSPTLPGAGEYSVYAKWQAAEDRATDATYEVTHGNGVDLVKVDQRHNGGEWRYLGTWSFDPSQSPKVSLLASLNGTVDADAVRFVSGDAIGGDIVYSHSDQIGTIQKLTDTSGALVWDRLARPFGETVSINALTGVSQHLRFRGQVADETGLNYNFYRDYDGSLGRYVESDPIGLDGGINTYAYAGNNSVSVTDPFGLKKAECFLPGYEKPGDCDEAETGGGGMGNSGGAGAGLAVILACMILDICGDDDDEEETSSDSDDEDCCEGKWRRVYREYDSKHGEESRQQGDREISRLPQNGQGGLDNSQPINPDDDDSRRIGYDEVFDETMILPFEWRDYKNCIIYYHGYVPSSIDDQRAWNVGKKAGYPVGKRPGVKFQ